MKKTIYILLTALALNLLNCYGAFGGTLNSIFGTCTYAWYGAGGHQGGAGSNLTIQGYDLVNSSGKWVSTIRALPEFKLHRMFVDNWIVVPETLSNNQTFALKTEPTEQNFYFDSFFKLQKANGIQTMWSASGCFDWYNLGTNPSTGKPYSQRKTACYNPQISPSNPEAWKDLAYLCKLIAERYKDNGLIDYIQILNEWDFRWNVPYVLKPQEYAVGFRMCYNAIRSVSQTQKIATGATLNADMATAKLLLRSIDSVFVLNGEQPPTDVYFTVNNYFRIGDSNQGSGVGATPEQVDRYGVYFKPLNDLLTEKKWKGFILTETGYNTSPSTSASAMKNKAPALEGYSLEDAQGILNIRTALMLASLDKCAGVTFYHCKDGYEAEPFTYHGWNYDKDFGGKEDWSPKPARTYCEAFLKQYGKYEVGNYRHNDSLYSVDLYASTDSLTLVWTDINKHGEYDAKPKEGQLTTTPPPTEPPTGTLKVSLSANPFPNSVPLNGFKAESGAKLYIWWDGTGKTPFTFQPSGQRESGAPYEYLGGKPVAFPDGTHTVTITDGNNVLIGTATFTVGTIVEPPVQEDVIKIWYEDGKIFYKTEKRTISNYAE